MTTSSGCGTSSPPAWPLATPPSTLLGVAVLGHPGRLVEIDAIAAVR